MTHCLKKFAIYCAVPLLFISPAMRAQSAAPARTQHDEAAPIHELELADTIVLSAPAPGAVVAGRKCDSRGNIYLIYSDTATTLLNQGHGAWDLPVTKVSPDSQSVSKYAIKPNPDYGTQYREAFNVDSSGTVYGLVTAFPREPSGDHDQFSKWPDHLIVKFKDDGSVDSTEELAGPGRRFSPAAFDVFSDGSYLVTGVLVSSQGSQRTTAPLTAIFGRDGRLVKELTLSDDVRPPETDAEKPDKPTGDSTTVRPRPWALEVGQGAIISGPDGNLYLLRASEPYRLYGISPGGEVVRQVKIPSPVKGLRLLEVSFVNEQTLFVEFSPVAEQPDVKTDFAGQTIFGLLDLTTGTLTTAYRMPADIQASTGVSGLLPGCPNGSGELSFLGTSKGGKLAIVNLRRD